MDSMETSSPASPLILTSGADPAFEQAHQAHCDSVRDYAHRWNLQYHWTQFPANGPNSSWLKLDATIRLLELHPSAQVLWIDADCQVLNPSINISPWIHNPLTFSMDYNGLCAGIFSASGPDGLALLKTTKEIGRLRNHSPDKAEQTTIRWLIAGSLRWNPTFFPQSIISNPSTPTHLRQHAWLHHHWASALRKP